MTWGGSCLRWHEIIEAAERLLDARTTCVIVPCLTSDHAVESRCT